jgi:RimJ/RimL family protein N-acetyltransferase
MFIGPEAYLGKGYAIPTLKAFTQFLRDKGIERLMIDPEVTNVKAIHVYERVGFKTVATFQPKPGQFAAGRDHYLMVLDMARGI